MPKRFSQDRFDEVWYLVSRYVHAVFIGAISYLVFLEIQTRMVCCFLDFFIMLNEKLLHLPSSRKCPARSVSDSSVFFVTS